MENQCCTFLESLVSIENACGFYDQTFHLKNDFTYYLTTLVHINLPVFLKSGAFYELSLDGIREILSNDNGLSEVVRKYDLFFGILDWAEKRCVADNLTVTATRKREIIGARLKNIRFETMSANEFMSCIAREPKFFTSSEIGDICLQIATQQYFVSQLSTSESINKSGFRFDNHPISSPMIEN